MNELTMKNAQVGQYRDLTMIGNEIRFLYTEGTKQELRYAIEIGRRLKEAKELVGHGQWAQWLTENVPFSQSKANKLMAVHDKFGASQESLFGDINSETFTNLGISQAFLLLSVPDDEIKEFVEENHVEDMTAAELRQALKERDEAIKAREAAEADAKMLRASNCELNQMANSAKKLQEEKKSAEAQADKFKAEKEAAEKKTADALTRAKAAEAKERDTAAELRQLRANPEIPQEKLDELKKQAAEEAGRQAEQKIKEAAAEAEKAQKTIESLQKQLAVASPEVTEFKTLFTEWQEVFNKLCKTLDKICTNDEETGEKLSNALMAAIERYKAILG